MNSANNPLRIMIVEDRTVAAISLECFFEDLGHVVTCVVATQHQAEGVLKTASDSVDLVVYDALLVGLPSLRLADRLKQLDARAIVTSNLSETDVRAMGFEDEYLPQPVAGAKVDWSLDPNLLAVSLAA